jgi:anti-anti-sigma factor
MPQTTGGRGPTKIYADVQLHISRNRKSGWIGFSGEIDAWNAEAVKAVLAKALLRGGDVHVDVSKLLFCDVTGIRAIVSAATGMEGGRRLVLHGMDPRLRQVFGVVGWGDMPSLKVEAEAVTTG